MNTETPIAKLIRLSEERSSLIDKIFQETLKRDPRDLIYDYKRAIERIDKEKRRIRLEEWDD